jgi:hypothetical protein
MIMLVGVAVAALSAWLQDLILPRCLGTKAPSDAPGTDA